MNHCITCMDSGLLPIAVAEWRTVARIQLEDGSERLDNLPSIMNL